MSKDLLWFRHDLNTADGRKFTMLRLKAGYEGHGIYWALVPHLYRASNCYPFATDMDKQLLASCLHLEVSKLIEFIDTCISCENLLEIVDGCLRSERIEQELDTRQGISKLRAKSGSKGGKQKASKLVANAKQTPSKDVAIQTDRQTDNNKQTHPAFVLPERLNNLACKEALKKWIKYRKGIKKKLSNDSIQAIIDEYAIKPQELVKNVNHSIAQGWQGLFEKQQPKTFDKTKTVPASESMNPALVAERRAQGLNGAPPEIKNLVEGIIK